MALPTIGLRSRAALIGVQAETTKGTANPSAAAMTAIVYNATGDPVDIVAPNSRKPDGHYHGNAPALIGAQVGRISWRQELASGDSTLTLLSACGMKLDTTYKFTSSVADQTCLTICLWQDGTLKKLVGAMGDFTFEGVNGGPVFGDFTFTGVWQAVTAVAMPAQAALTALTRYGSAASTFTIGGAVVPKISTWRLRAGNSIIMRPDYAAAAGVIHALVESRNPQFECDFESHLVADHDPYGGYLAGTLAALSLVLSDGANTLTVTAPKMQYVGVPEQRGGVIKRNMCTFQCNANAGDDEVTITRSA